MAPHNAPSLPLIPSVSPNSTPIELDEEGFHLAVMMFKWKHYGGQSPPANCQALLDNVMRHGLFLQPGSGGFVRKRPLLPLWLEFITTIWQPMSKAPKIAPLDFSKPHLTTSRAADFLKWIAPRRTCTVDAAGQPADGTRWWPHDTQGVLAAVQGEERKRRREEKEEAARRAKWAIDPCDLVRVLEWRKGVEVVEWEEAMLLGVVSRAYDARAPLAEGLRRPAWGLDEEEEVQFGAEAATPLGESSIQAAGIDGRGGERQLDETRRQAMVQVAQTLAQDYFSKQ